jgi:hypothetical protein
MACELIEYCQFCNDNMKGMPIAADYVKSKLCFGNYEHCNRYRMYQQQGGVDIQCEPNPSDAEEVAKLIQCLRSQQSPKD